MNIIRPSNVPWIRDASVDPEIDLRSNGTYRCWEEEKIKVNGPNSHERMSPKDSKTKTNNKKESKTKRNIIFIFAILLSAALAAGVTYLILKYSNDDSYVYVSPCTKFICTKGKCYVNSDGSPECVTSGGGTGGGSSCANAGYRIPEIGSECPNGWLQYNSSCYKEFPEQKTWCKARDYCRGLSADLVSMLDEEESYFLINNMTGNVVYWTGLNDLKNDGNFNWSDGSIGNFTNWENGEPDNAKNNEDCVYISRNSTWHDDECSMSFSFICKMTIFPQCGSGWFFYEDACYSFNHNASVSWMDAQNECQNETSDLVSINSKKEWHFILSQLTKWPFESLWIGLNDLDGDGNYTWVDGRGSKFSRWQEGEPNVEGHLCVSTYSNNGNWYDNNCTDSLGYICERDISNII